MDCIPVFILATTAAICLAALIISLFKRYLWPEICRKWGFVVKILALRHIRIINIIATWNYRYKHRKDFLVYKVKIIYEVKPKKHLFKKIIADLLVKIIDKETGHSSNLLFDFYYDKRESHSSNELYFLCDITAKEKRTIRLKLRKPLLLGAIVFFKKGKENIYHLYESLEAPIVAEYNGQESGKKH